MRSDAERAVNAGVAFKRESYFGGRRLSLLLTASPRAMLSRRARRINLVFFAMKRFFGGRRPLLLLTASPHAMLSGEHAAEHAAKVWFSLTGES